jgi:GABA(A) receptor-associated protein
MFTFQKGNSNGDNPPYSELRSFKEKNSLERRSKMSRDISEKYPTKIGIILSSNNLKINKNKFIIDSSFQISHFLMHIKKFIEIQPDEAIYLFVNNTLPPSSELLSNIYNRFKDEDGFLYITVSKESTFG